MNEFERLEKIIGKDNINNLSNKTILVLGLGGVGGYVVESLARSGIGNLIICDMDVVDKTNINRQIIALNSTIGKYKTDLFYDRIKDINPKCNVIKITKRIDLENYEELFKQHIDYFVDACDTVTVKKIVIKTCIDKNIPIISSMGTGNKFRPELLEIVDVRKTINDPLARIIRKYVKDEGIREKVMVLSSKELPKKTHTRIVGSTAFVPPSAGLLITSYIINEFLKEVE